PPLQQHRRLQRREGSVILLRKYQMESVALNKFIRLARRVLCLSSKNFTLRVQGAFRARSCYFDCMIGTDLRSLDWRERCSQMPYWMELGSAEAAGRVQQRNAMMSPSRRSPMARLIRLNLRQWYFRICLSTASSAPKNKYRRKSK